jgi:hemerythrin-like domain-containing protein
MSTSPQSVPVLALASLVSEHRLLSRLVDALSGFAEHLEGDCDDGPADLLGFVELLEGFADLGHHHKEEQFIVPELVRHGVSWQADSLARLQQDHEQSRYLVDVLSQAARQQESWSAEDRRQVMATIRTFVQLECAHIVFENTHVLPAISERLDERELAALAERLEDADDRFGRENYARLSEAAEKLIRRYGRESR